MADLDTDKGGPGHPDPEIKGGGAVFSRPFRPQFGPKMRGARAPLDPPLERVMTQRGNLRALAVIYQFHLLVFRGCN